MTKLRTPINAKDHTQGPEGASIALLEYGDYQCPYCAAAHSKVKEIQNQFPHEVLFAFRHFPLTEIHEFALMAAMAAEAAGVQGRFWEMHDMLFENQAILGPEAVRQFALELDLDMDKFDSHRLDAQLSNKVKTDFMSGVRSGVNGTPSFFVGNTKYEGPIERVAFERILRAA